MRPREDIEEMKVPRVWDCQIRGIRYTHLDELLDVFLQIQVGYNFKLKKKYNKVALNRLKTGPCGAARLEQGKGAGPEHRRRALRWASH